MDEVPLGTERVEEAITWAERRVDAVLGDGADPEQQLSAQELGRAFVGTDLDGAHVALAVARGGAAALENAIGDPEDAALWVAGYGMQMFLIGYRLGETAER